MPDKNKQVEIEGNRQKAVDDFLKAAESKASQKETFSQDLPIHQREIALEPPREIMKPQNLTDSGEGVWFDFDYYRSPGYLERLRNAGLKEEPLKIQPIQNYLPYDSPVVSFASGNDLYLGEGPSFLRYPVVTDQSGKPTISSTIIKDNEDAKGASPGVVGAHEAAHLNPLYNTKYKEKAAPAHVYQESPYYKNDYSKIPARFKYLLKPKNASTLHEKELSENYSDLMGLRYFLYQNGIFDSTQPGKTFTSEDYNKLLDAEGGEDLRFLKNHTKQQVIDAINEVALGVSGNQPTPDDTEFV